MTVHEDYPAHFRGFKAGAFGIEIEGVHFSSEIEVSGADSVTFAGKAPEEIANVSESSPNRFRRERVFALHCGQEGEPQILEAATGPGESAREALEIEYAELVVILGYQNPWIPRREEFTYAVIHTV